VSGPVIARLPGGRLHFQHGPIDLILLADGEPGAVHEAYARAWDRFQTVLEELVSELAILKTPLSDEPPAISGRIARGMVSACRPFRAKYITPMAAVAGAVAEEILNCMMSVPVRRAMVNNGGDIAFALEAGSEITLGVVDDPELPGIAGKIKIRSSDPSRGVATSGWRGRSQSLGIADAVTVLARTAAEADAAATMVANAVNVEHPAISRAPASLVKDDSDLGNLLVTVDVGKLPPDAIDEALANGEQEARALVRRGLIHGAALLLKGQSRVIASEVWFPLPALRATSPEMGEDRGAVFA
jgi:ApbE superfamily uncharacterized protein (UPF0280 family)